MKIIRSFKYILVVTGFLVLVFGQADTSLSKTEKTENVSKQENLQVLVFSGTGWFRHPEIPMTNGWLVRLGMRHNIRVDVTETPGDISEESLQKYDVFLINNANELDLVFDEVQRNAIEQWYRNGGGIVGLHAALVRQQGWTWFSELGGCDFDSDSNFQKAKLRVDSNAKKHPTVQGYGPEFWYSADWHNHTRSVTGLEGVQVLLRADESTYEPVRPYFQERGGQPMGDDHPVSWIREYDGGRFFYTELGHDLRSLNTEFGRMHILEAIKWAAR